MSAIDMLEAQHREVEELFEKFEDAKGNAKRDLFEQIANKLAVHAAIEEKHFYPALKSEETEDQLLEAAEEHLQVKRLIADLLALEPSDETFDAKMKVLKEEVEHHVEEEETELFAAAEDLLDDDMLDALEQEMTATQEELLATGQPARMVPKETERAAPIG
jgi:hemerythrin-like domain-containing protein